MNVETVPQKRSRAPTIIFWTIGLTIFFASLALAANSHQTVANWFWDSLGMLYGTLLSLSGLAAMHAACKNTWNSRAPTGVARVIQVALLPTIIGLIGSVHGYMNIHHSISHLGASINEAEMPSVHATLLSTFLVGVCFSMLAFAIIAIRIRFRRNQQHSAA